MCTDYLERPYERPAVGVKLGRSDVELGQQLSLETSKGKSELHLFEKCRVEEAERLATARFVVSADRLLRVARQHDHLAIMLLVKGKIRLVPFP